MRVLLLYPPNQNWAGSTCKPNGSLAYPCLAAALMEAGIDVEIYDACVGNDQDDLAECFYKSTPLPSGMVRTGVSDERILEVVKDWDIIGLTSIFTDQETMVLDTAKLIKAKYPEKLILSGGVNARNRLGKFLSSSVDAVALSEAEKTLVQLVRRFESGSRDFSDISSVAFMKDGAVVVNPTLPSDVVMDLDKLPIPAWHLLPNERYWKIRRPHGGHFETDEDLKYASIMTSLGCVFECAFCHVAGEVTGSLSGNIGAFRVKSDDRVLREIDVLKSLGVKQVFIEDDMLFGRKKRMINLMRKIQEKGLQIIDVNGISVIHLFEAKTGEPDDEVLKLMVDTGFREVTLAFESANQRMLKKYATNKWPIGSVNVKNLIKRCNEFGLRISGNYMLGYPDETREEIENTIAMAKQHREWGIDSASFFCVIPLPGTPLFDMALREGYIKDFDPDKMTWLKGNMVNTAVPADELEEMRSRAWREINDARYVKLKTDDERYTQMEKKA